ncbi:PAS domain-containing protein [Pedobacter frigidisoli]|uniref:PAS domain-containing protein n=1 Tax=Pedobacter frigidisoli TaxID=2530455 RepID=UPI00292D106B|nr:PAS domain-containing protein [Pedobacter frigidisoli]
MLLSRETLDVKHFRVRLTQAREAILDEISLLIKKQFSTDEVEIRLGALPDGISNQKASCIYSEIPGDQQEVLGVIIIHYTGDRIHQDQLMLDGMARMLGVQLSAMALSSSMTDDYDLIKEEFDLFQVELDVAYDDLNVAQQELSESYNLGLLLNRNLSRLRVELKAFLDQAPIAFGIVRHRQLKIEIANKLILNLWGKDKSVIGKPMSIALPELIGQPYLDILDEVYTSGTRYVGKEASVMLELKNGMEEVFFNFIYEPLINARGNTSAIMIIATDVTQQTRKGMEMKLELENYSLKSDQG